MKILTYEYQNKEQVGILTEDGKYVVPAFMYADMQQLIKHAALGELAGIVAGGENKVALTDVKLLAPIPEPAQDLICLGINYQEHDTEIAHSFGKEQLKKRNVPIYFSKRVNRAVDPDGFIDGHFNIVDSLDYESELAVVIGKDAKNVSEEDVQDYIFGYTIVNDVSARNVQTAYKQWYFGKSMDDFTPMGPWIVTADEISFPPKLDISCSVNGELRQNSNTRLLVHGIAHIISELSQGMTLQAGTIIVTGTPGGVGMGMKPPCFLQPGDVVTCAIEKIGKLTNIVK